MVYFAQSSDIVMRMKLSDTHILYAEEP